MKKISNAWKWLSNLGIPDDVSFLEKQRMLFLNRICVATVLLLCPLVFPVVNPITWMDTSVILFFNVLLLVLMYFKKHLLARYLFVILNTGGVYYTSARTEYFQGEYLYFPLIIGVTPLIMDYKNKWNILFSTLIVFGFYVAFELGLDVDAMEITSTQPIQQFRLNFLYLMIGCMVISYFYLDITTRQQNRLQEANDQLVSNQQQLIEAKEMAENSAKAKMHFLSIMSHEIRTPLNTVIGLSELMKMQDLPNSVKENIELINFASNSLFSIVSDILDWSKMESGKVELEQIGVNITGIVNHINASGKLLCEKKNIEFKSEIDPELPQWIKSDETRLTQILNNLMNNAIKFTVKGEVKFIVQVLHKNETEVRIRFSISDTGIGMTEEQAKKIFEVFEQGDAAITRKFGGSGLGLFISKKIVTLMNGEIHVSSKSGEGSVFSFELSFPLSKSVEEITEIKFSDVLKGKSVLVVDDNQLNLLVAENFLNQWGLKNERALSGKEALSKISKHPFDLILMDLSMPEMDGYETSIEIRNRGYLGVPIIALTASALIDDQEKVFSSGMNDYESKPFKPASLYQKLVHHLS